MSAAESSAPEEIARGVTPAEAAGPEVPMRPAVLTGPAAYIHRGAYQRRATAKMLAKR